MRYEKKLMLDESRRVPNENSVRPVADVIPQANCKFQSVLGLASARGNEIPKFAEARLRTGGASSATGVFQRAE